LAKSQKDGKKNRLRTLKDLDSAALQLATACKVLVNSETEDNQVREEVWQKLTPEQLAEAIASVEELARPPGGNRRFVSPDATSKKLSC
jgi:predicted component of type VI protein secretion system